jgi:pyruvate kinase
LQWQLIPLGLSSLGRLEARVMPTLDSVIASCAAIAGEGSPSFSYDADDFLKGEEILSKNTKEVFGAEPKERYTRIMVTLATEAAYDPLFVENLVAKGMEVARINCSHDSETVWEAMINNVREAANKLGKKCKVSMEVPGPKIRVSRIMTTMRRPRVIAGDTLYLTGSKQMYLPQGVSLALCCSIPEIVAHLKTGEPVMIDDGHVEARVIERLKEGVLLKVERVISENGVKVSPEKGINFPNMEYRIPLFSERDEEILDFICANADIVGLSFIRDTEDVTMVLDEIEKRTKTTLPVMLKIETLTSVRILPDVITAAASRVPTAVMIARGDLAVEVGYTRLSEYQEEILWICEAAHVPVVWATQVLETLVETGIPTRAEISDVTLGAQSECIMLNKGEHIVDAVVFVDDVLSKFEKHIYKKTAILRKLTIASNLFT